MEFAGTERFQVLARLGAGGMGVVYQAFDRDRNALVALKTLKHLHPDGLFRFKQEFRTLSDLDHPNLCSLGELICEDGLWFFTMELVDGVDLLQWVRPGDAPRAPELAPTAQDAKAGDRLDVSPSADTMRSLLASKRWDAAVPTALTSEIWLRCPGVVSVTKPKSSSTTRPSLSTSTLVGLMSRWILLAPCKACSPVASWPSAARSRTSS